jgi:dTDP-4-amino-4,6-dideoxygalactose transaminase
VSGPGGSVFSDDERREVLDVLSSGHLSRYGSLDDHDFKHKVYSLEREFAASCGVEHTLATSSGTASLLISLLALGIGEGDEVLVPGFTYVASVAAVVYARATPVLVEVDESLTIDPEDARCKVTSRTQAIIAVHMLGNPCDMQAIEAIADEFGLFIIEDVCQAAGGSYRGRKLGSIGSIGVFSFNRFKMMSSGEGGLITTNDTALYERAFGLHDQGHVPLRAGKTAGPRSLIGLNFKMNELTGAVALAQIRKLDEILATLRANKAALKNQIPETPSLSYRLLNDAEGECATMLTLLFSEQHNAEAVAAKLGSCTVASSGWHNYAHMKQIVHHKTPVDLWSAPAKHAAPGALPQTDAILRRALNISIGVVDAGLGASFGINIRSTDDEIAAVANQLRDACIETQTIAFRA